MDTTPPQAWGPRRVAIGIATVTLGYLVASIAASVVRNPSHPTILGPGPLLWTVVAGVVAGATFGPLGRRLQLSTGGRFGVLLVVSYSLAGLSNLIEALLFVRGVMPVIVLAGVFGLRRGGRTVHARLLHRFQHLHDSG